MKKAAPAVVKVVKKTSEPGKFVYKPIKSKILLCSCGNKYVKTRNRQKVCLMCLRERS